MEKQYHYIEPEVAGGLGELTILDTTVHPPTVTQLNYEFFGWLEDDILESFPCYIVTGRLAEAMRLHNLTGVTFDRVTVSTSEEFPSLNPTVTLPNFEWLKINGKVGSDDFVISIDNRLLVSEKTLELLNQFNIKHAILQVY